eukprot:scaffold429_cov22-Tisochrysis_lutea.AAC.1
MPNFWAEAQPQAGIWHTLWAVGKSPRLWERQLPPVWGVGSCHEFRGWPAGNAGTGQLPCVWGVGSCKCRYMAAHHSILLCAAMQAGCVKGSLRRNFKVAAPHAAGSAV